MLIAPPEEEPVQVATRWPSWCVAPLSVEDYDPRACFVCSLNDTDRVEDCSGNMSDGPDDRGDRMGEEVDELDSSTDGDGDGEGVG